MSILHKKQLVEAETEKIKEKRKATVVAKTHEEKIIIAIGKYSMGVIAVFFTGLAICIAIWKSL
jgi:hypothetical protein